MHFLTVAMQVEKNSLAKDAELIGWPKSRKQVVSSTGSSCDVPDKVGIGVVELVSKDSVMDWASAGLVRWMVGIGDILLHEVSILVLVVLTKHPSDASCVLSVAQRNMRSSNRCNRICR